MPGDVTPRGGSSRRSQTLSPQRGSASGGLCLSPPRFPDPACWHNPPRTENLCNPALPAAESRLRLRASPRHPPASPAGSPGQRSAAPPAAPPAPPRRGGPRCPAPLRSAPRPAAASAPTPSPAEAGLGPPSRCPRATSAARADAAQPRARPAPHEVAVVEEAEDEQQRVRGQQLQAEGWRLHVRGRRHLARRPAAPPPAAGERVRPPRRAAVSRRGGRQRPLPAAARSAPPGGGGPAPRRASALGPGAGWRVTGDSRALSPWRSLQAAPGCRVAPRAPSAVPATKRVPQGRLSGGGPALRPPRSGTARCGLPEPGQGPALP